MGACIKQVVVVEVSQTVYFWSLVLEVDKCRYGFGEYVKIADVFI